MIRRSVAIERWFFGDITLTDYERHSHPTPSYNCIAYAAGDLFEWWQAGAYWPLDVYPADRLADLINAYVAVGFENCGMNGLPEKGFEKVVLYQGTDSKWTHAARLRPDGWWESKIGEFDDILHKTPTALEGSKYGKVACYMKRSLADAIKARIAAKKRARENGKW